MGFFYKKELGIQPRDDGLTGPGVDLQAALVRAAGEGHAVGGECAVDGVLLDDDGVAVHGGKGGLVGYGALDTL